MRTLLILIILFGNAASWWKPKPGTSWQWQLQGTIDQTKDVQMYDIDLFDTPISTIAQLHAAGRVVICYFSAGSFEDWRPDANQFPDTLKSKQMSGWNEAWLDISQLNTSVLGSIMLARLDLAKTKGCDGVEPDNVDAWKNSVNIVLSVTGTTRNYGGPITGQMQLTYNMFLSNAAHERGLSVGLKNDMDQIPQLISYYDWALNEQCNEFNECDTLVPFVSAGKAVFGVEYNLNPSQFCANVNQKNFDYLKKTLALQANPFTQCRNYTSGPYCGDNLCESTEVNCPIDCSQGTSQNGKTSQNIAQSVSQILPNSQDISIEEDSSSQSSNLLFPRFLLGISVILFLFSR